jgi:hypothetical protein
MNNINNNINNAAIPNLSGLDSSKTSSQTMTSFAINCDPINNALSNHAITTLNVPATNIKLTPDEFCQRLIVNALPDSTITVTGNINIENCDICSLPKNLIVSGNLTIERCHNISQIIGNIKAESISISDCNNFTGIITNSVKIKELHISHCDNFVKLPDNFKISKLSISHCSLIARLPKDITIYSSFCIDNCLNITELPRQFKKNKKLPRVHIMSITSCDNIIIPEGLRVLGILRLINCNHITSLPEMHIGSLIIDSCTNLQHMPEKFILSRNMTIKNCNKLTKFPKAWIHNIPFSCEHHKIKCIDTGISKEHIKSFYDEYLLNNIIITTESTKAKMSIIELIGFWQSASGNKDNINIGKMTYIESYSYLLFFNLLAKTKSYLNENTRTDLANKVITILKNISKNNWFKVEALKIIQSATTYNFYSNGDTDRVLIALGKLEILPRKYSLIKATSKLKID